MPSKGRERKDERIRPKKKELHELPYFEIVKSGTIRLDSGMIMYSKF